MSRIAAIAAVAALALVAGTASAGPSARLPQAPACPVFPASNPWNQRVDRLPVAANSDRIVAAIGRDDNLHADFGSGLWEGGPIGIPITVVRGTQRKVRVAFEYAGESDTGPYPIPANVAIEGGSDADGDRHALIVDRDGCRLYELFALYPTAGGGWRAGSGAIFDLRSNRLRPAGWTSADAAGLPILPGLARYEEVARGRIDHAPLHRLAHAARVRLARAPLRERRDRPEPAADGAPRAAEAELSDRRLPPPGPDRPPGAEGVRDDPRRQRLRLVRQRRAPPEVVDDQLHALRRVPGSAFEVVDTRSMPRK